MNALLLATSLLAAPAQLDGVRVSVSAGAAAAASDSRPYHGDLEDIADGLGATFRTSGSEHFVPVLSQAIWLPETSAEWRAGLRLTERYWRYWAEMRSGTIPASSHRIDRSVVAVDAMFELLFGKLDLNHPGRFVLSGGPAVYWYGTRERGWLGASESVDTTVGARGALGGRFGYRGALVLEATIDFVPVPHTTTMLADGGRITFFAIGLRGELWL